MDWLRDSLAQSYFEKGFHFLKDPWKARDEYIAVIIDRSPQNIERFLSKHAADELTAADKILALKLLELQRHAMLM
jgi:alpha-amylase/alpha-mannosidase (GH57 family)